MPSLSITFSASSKPLASQYIGWKKPNITRKRAILVKIFIVFFILFFFFPCINIVFLRHYGLYRGFDVWIISGFVL